MVLYRSVTVVSLMFCMGSPTTPPPTPHTDFGCLFSEKGSFQLKYLPLVNNTWGPDAVYGRAVPPIEIEEKDLDDFKAYIEFVKRNILRNNVFDEANYYARLYINTRVRRVRNPEMLIDTLLEFYQSPMKERHDNLGLIMKVFTDIRSGKVVDPEQINMAEKIKGWAEALKTQALYIAAVSTSELGLSYDYFARKRSQEVLPDSKINAIVGVIKIKHMNDTGYMIVDMKRALTPLPLIWTNTQSASTQYEVAKSLGDVYRYRIIGRDKTYIKFRKESEEVSMNAIYIELPLCSFLHTMNYQFYHKFRATTIFKLSEDQNSRQAYIMFYVKPMRVDPEKTFLVYFERGDSVKIYTFEQVADLTEDERADIFTNLEKILNIDQEELRQTFQFFENVKILYMQIMNIAIEKRNEMLKNNRTLSKL